MEIRKTKLVTKEVEETVECYDVCDKCGIRINTVLYDAFDFDFELKTGTSYPEGGSGDKWMLDLCEDCAKAAIELLKANGYKVREEEWDW